jgi:sRNA-binding carbon storage regulator CsrA
MLVLSRRSQEAVVVGATDGGERLLRITVLEIRAGHVKLGFEAEASLCIVGKYGNESAAALKQRSLPRDRSNRCPLRIRRG